jgi:hypothetical protein
MDDGPYSSVADSLTRNGFVSAVVTRKTNSRDCAGRVALHSLKPPPSEWTVDLAA